MGGRRAETVRQVCVDGQELAHTVSGMSAEGVQLVPLLSRVGGWWGFPHHHGSQLVLGVRRPRDAVFHCRGRENLSMTMVKSADAKEQKAQEGWLFWCVDLHRGASGGGDGGGGEATSPIHRQRWLHAKP